MAIVLLGQPRIQEWALTMTIVCPCTNVFLFIGNIGAMRACQGPGCKRVYKLNAWPTFNEDTGLLDVRLGIGVVGELGDGKDKADA